MIGSRPLLNFSQVSPMVRLGFTNAPPPQKKKKKKKKKINFANGQDQKLIREVGQHSETGVL